MYIDIHGHARDFNQRKKETIAHVLEVCRDIGIDAFFDMPNTDPPVMWERDVLERLRLAKEANVPEVFYGIYIGLTSNPEQIKEAVRVKRKHFPHVVGMKLYAGHSVGKLGVIGLDGQDLVYTVLAEENYLGVLSVHAEQEGSLKLELWNPSEPITHCFARPAESEVDSVKDQLYLARRTNFRGKLHFAHLSVPEAVDLVVAAKKEGKDVSCEVCPHHLIFDWNIMRGEKGIWFKVNPPLREVGVSTKMLEYLRGGLIDIVATDHAPHTEEDKTCGKFMSGIVGLPYWPLLEEYLRRSDFTEAQIRRVMFENAAKRFGIDVERRVVKVKDRRGDYPFNFYSGLEQQLGFKW